ncbi:RidA family protein [Georgenia satyanarayanai]|uniref:RidA family protein n=1 Tax=Georgenia satyanarayanai TaxID=860221 RepID=UPI002041D1B3|nr:RidA family protein [Georgenia satyanarayanai]MCM3660263.1 RidA family protein [Georgenia satyanarayanai]
MTARQSIRTAEAPAPAHSFSQGVRHGLVVQVSGQGPVDAATGEYLHPGDVRAQTRLTLANVTAVLAAASCSWDEVVMVRVYLARQEDFAAMNEAYAAFVGAAVAGDVLPCRTTVVVGLPRPDMLVEIDAMAVSG